MTATLPGDHAATQAAAPTATSTTPPRLRHVPALEGLRGVAVAAVVATHAGAITVPEWKRYLAPGGYLGVDVFFVLSGFLITTLLLDERTATGRASLARFYERRALRLLPALLALLAAHVVYAFATGYDRRLELKSVGAALLYGLNWQFVLTGRTTTGLGHLWSLAVEEQFYAVWPLVLALAALASARLRRFGLPALLAGIVAIALWRVHLTLGPSPRIQTYVRTDARLDAPLIGAAIAIARHHGLQLPARPARVIAWGAVLGLGALMVIGAGPYSRTMLLYGYAVAAPLAAVVVLVASDVPWAGATLLAVAPLRLLGRLSYAIYLFHVPVVFAVYEHLGDRSPTIRLAAVLAGTAATASVCHLAVELPFLRLKDRRAARRRSASEALA